MQQCIRSRPTYVTQARLTLQCARCDRHPCMYKAISPTGVAKMSTGLVPEVLQAMLSLCFDAFSVSRPRISITASTSPGATPSPSLPFDQPGPPLGNSMPAQTSGAVTSSTMETARIGIAGGGGHAGEGRVPSILEYHSRPPQNPWLTSAKLMFASPWKRFKKGSFLRLKMTGDIPEKNPPWFLPTASPCMPVLCECIRKAAHDPRVGGLYLHIEALSIGYARLQEIIAHVEFFRRSGKPTVAYIERGSEREYMLAAACEEIYVPPLGLVLLFGHCVQGVYVRGALDKVGLEPSVKRLGKYKTGNMLLRKDMSEEEREMWTALLDGIHSQFVAYVAKARGKTGEEVQALVDEGVYDMRKLVEGGWITGVKYPDEIEEDMDKRFGNEKRKKQKAQPNAQLVRPAVDGVPGSDLISEKPPKKLTYVEYKKYKSVPPATVGLAGRKVVAVVRECGSITGGGKEEEGRIRAEPLIKKLRKLAEDRSVAGIVLHVSSGGGDALASDLMWREIRKIAKDKPLVATMGDVAASGGYYMSMGAPTVLAQPLTFTGSIGVVLARLNVSELYNKIGFSKTVLSRGKYAEIYQEARAHSDAEDALIEGAIHFAYNSFRDKAAQSRDMSAAAMEQHAQGRVWLGKHARTKGLVDHEGGISNAVALVKQAASIPPRQQVTIREVSSRQFNPRDIISGGGASVGVWGMLWMLLRDPGTVLGLLCSTGHSHGSATLQADVMSRLPASCAPAAAALYESAGQRPTGPPPLQVDSEVVRQACGSGADVQHAHHAALLPALSMPSLHVGPSHCDTSAVASEGVSLPPGGQ